MKLTVKFFVLALMLVLLGAGASHALPISYGTATHNTTAWQELATYENGVQTSQYGVFWSLDGGSTWGQETDLKVGDQIQFKLNMHKQNVGTHYADHVKAWVDWGQDGWFDEADWVVSDFQELPAAQGSSLKPAPGEADFSFLSGLYTITKDMAGGDLYLRARTVCSSSLNNAAGRNVAHDAPSDNSYFLPVGYLNQGEVEEWALNVAPTPVPPSLLMFGTGLIGFAAAARRRFRK